MIDLKKVAENFLATISAWEKTACVHLTGGEPLLKPELFPLLENLDRQPVISELGIITNGFFIDAEMMKKFSTFAKLKKIKISIDGADAEINDSIRQRGAWEKVMENLTLLKKPPPFEIIFMFTAMRRNFRNLRSLIGLCQDLGIDGLIIERFIPWGRGRKIKDEALDKEEWKELTRGLFQLFSLEPKEEDFFTYQAFQISFHRAKTKLLAAPCIIGVDGLCIMPDGHVFPCRRFPISIGNLLNESLKTIWEKSVILKDLRKKENLKGKCGTCGIKDCRGCRSLALSLTGDCLAEDPHCWHGEIFPNPFR